MIVTVWVRETPIEVNVGPGLQRLKWLALLAVQRYDAESSSGGFSCVHVPTGLMDADGKLLPPNKSIRIALSEGQHVYALIQADEEEQTGQMGRTAKGTSAFVMTQGAAPAECRLDGYGIGQALAGRESFMYVTARDTYGNYARNGGEVFSVRIEEIGREEPTSAYALKAQQDEEPPSASISDLGNGAYILTHKEPTKGCYELAVLLDGEPIHESPLRIITVNAKVPSMVKWLSPRVSGHMQPLEHAASVVDGRQMIVFGGRTAEGYSDELRTIDIELMRWEEVSPVGNCPAPRAGAAYAVTAGRMVLYGGEGEGGYLDSCHALDLKSKTWTSYLCRGISPGVIAYAAAAAIGSKVYIFGGTDGTQLGSKLYVLDLSSLIWDVVDDGASAELPEPRMHHSMTAVREQLCVYGGRGLDGKAVVVGLAVFDLKSEMWTYPKCRGDIPSGRWGHSAFLWASHLVIGLGAEYERETNVISILDLENYAWEAWDGNCTRVGHVCHLVEGKFFALGGRESVTGEQLQAEVLQLNLEGYMIEMDGVDDVIMIPHLPTIIPNAYTMEAWVRPAKVGPMNIVCRSDEQYSSSVWSHQLRINASGRLEHYLEADGKHTVFHTASVIPGHWYHVAGVAQAGGEMKLIVNGKEEGQAVDVGKFRSGLDRYFIGAASGDGMGMFEGSVAEFRVWNYALSEDEVHDNMRKALTGVERGQVGYWRVNEGPGGMIVDHSNYGNVGAIKGEPRWTASTVPIQQ